MFFIYFVNLIAFFAKQISKKLINFFLIIIILKNKKQL